MQVQRFDPFSVLSRMDREFDDLVRESFGELIAGRGKQPEGLALDTLSMGMSADLEAAIAEGATLVRVGTAVFGDR